MRQPVSLAFIAGQLGLGGAEKQLYLLVRGLLQAGWRVSMMTLNPYENDYWENPLRELGVSVVSVPRVPRWHRMLVIAEQLRGQRVQLVHGWAFHAGPYTNLSGRLAGVPVRLGALRGHPSYWPDSCLMRLMVLIGLVGLDGIVANSQAAASALERHNKRYLPPLYVVPNAVLVPDLDNRESLRLNLAKKWHLQPDIPWLVGLGRLDRNKNWGLLLAAYRKLIRQGTRFHLVLIGEGPERKHLEMESSKLHLMDCIRFVGSHPEASAILPAFDLLCLPSRSEGLPNVAMEASAAGLPVVATTVGGVPEVVEDGMTGFLVPPDDAHALAKRLEQLLTDPSLRCRMGQAGREKMQREFSVERMVTQMIAVYEDALQAKGIL